MTPGTDKRGKGLESFGAVYGEASPASSLPPAGTDRFIDFMLESLFAELWTNETLPVRDRRLILLGVVAAQGATDIFRIQAEAALNKGELTPAQLVEALVMLTQYVGYPRASAMRAVAAKDLLTPDAG